MGKHILKLWEENCVIRKTVKQKKREKRVLVREVKQLQQAVKDLKEINKSSSIIHASASRPSDEDALMADTIIGSDEERLIIELEEHVASSIRLHERLISGSEFDHETEIDQTSMEESIFTNLTSDNTDMLNVVSGGTHTKYELVSSRHHTNSSELQIEGIKPKLLS